jgi:GntR family transcriptional regulator / MocR family aminotransferase
MKRDTLSTLITLPLDTMSALPLHRQLYEALRVAILGGKLKPGYRLPSSRVLASELSLGRSTVILAFEQLIAEGYLEGQAGSGTFVTRVLPESLLHIRPVASQQPRKREQGLPPLSKRGHLMATTLVTPANLSSVKAFIPGLPDLAAFPLTIWKRISAKCIRKLPSTYLNYGEPQGYLPLRVALADYLSVARGVTCQAEHIHIFNGSQQALDLTARVLLDPGDCVCVEEPGYLGAKAVFLSAGATLRPLEVDREGINIAIANVSKGYSAAKLVYVTPSHHYPLGMTMSLTRRLELLDWAHRNQAWILEDDYDSEFRYVGRPVAALQGLDTREHTLYMGTFSKVLFPSLRLGYMVIPPRLREAFAAAHAQIDFHSSLLDQMIVTEFMVEGHFARHLRRMRALYSERQEVLRTKLEQVLGGLINVNASEGGMNLVAWLPKHTDDVALTKKAARAGLETTPLSAYYLNSRRAAPGLQLGFTCVSKQQLKKSVYKLAAVLNS